MQDLKKQATRLLNEFKGDAYTFGFDCFQKTGEYAAELGGSAMLIASTSDWFRPAADQLMESLRRHGVKVVPDFIVPGAAPNAPREDVYRLESYILHFQPEVLVVAGGGSSIDAVKAAAVLAALGRYNGDIEAYFGTGQVTAALEKIRARLLPIVAAQTAASSAAHLTKYSNVTDPVAGQKKLIVDEAIVPPRAVFDYSLTKSMPKDLTLDGAFDGLAHCLEVFYGASSEDYEKIAEIAETGIELIVRSVQRFVEKPDDLSGREALGLATDLGGYAIMVGGTNGAHLTSFSLVDVTSHGRACAIMNPYYTVFFAPAIEKQLKAVGRIYQRAGLISADLESLTGRQLGEAVASGMIELGRRVGFPTKLSDLPGFTDEHIERALAAAKNPQLDMKLRNMPVSLNASLVDEYMGPILEAAKTGDLSLIKNM